LYNHKYCGAELALDIWTLKIYFASRLIWRYRIKFLDANAFTTKVKAAVNSVVAFFAAPKFTVQAFAAIQL
jgi:hypothetical protein